MGNIGRISTFAIHQSTLRDASRTQEELANLQIQLSSGLKSQSFTGIADQTEQFLGLESKMSRTKLYKDNNAVVATRLETTDNVLGQVIETVTSLRNLIIQRRNGAVQDTLAFDQQIDGLWRSLVSELNTTLEGRYMFSGTRTDSPPVSDTDFPTLEEPGVPDDGYYLGSSDNISLRADETITITYNVRANEPGFQKVFAALATAKEGHDTDNADLLKSAYELVDKGLNEIISTRARVNSNKLSLDELVDRQGSLILYWQGVKEEIANTDMVSVSTQVAINQGILQASFQAFGRINSLRLSDYLR
jgi:flagellar hook-associated protein 3 FlgL